MKRQTIAFDLYGTLIPECGEFSCVRTGGIARLLYKRSLRRDAHALLRSLIAGGNRVVVYSTTTQSAKRLKAWFWLMGIPVTRVITKAEHEKRLRQQGVVPFGFKAPHLFGIDLLIDDCPHTVEAVKESGTNAVLVTNQEPDWTLKVRTACRLNQATYKAEQRQTA
jgi:FMN phosphatase YigB (HAD superfamily)